MELQEQLKENTRRIKYLMFWVGSIFVFLIIILIILKFDL